MSDLWWIYSTFPSRGEAISAARALVEKRLAACANIHEITSVYRWDGKIHEGPEAALVLKTSRARLQEASEEIKRLHSYEVPCIIATPVAGGYPPFLEWVTKETT